MWMSVRGLVAKLLEQDQDLPVFVRMWEDRGVDQDCRLTYEPLYDGQVLTERVDYPTPHVGGYYGNAVVLGAFDDEAE